MKDLRDLLKKEEKLGYEYDFLNFQINVCDSEDESYDCEMDDVERKLEKVRKKILKALKKEIKYRTTKIRK